MKPSSSRLSAPVTSLRLVRERNVQYEQRITSAQIAFEVLRPFLEDLAQEAFFVIGLDTKNRINVIHEIAIGSAGYVAFNPSDVAKVLLLANATGCIVAHNHPSGSPEPSPEDRALTKRLKELMALLGIRFLDHIIVGEGRYYSFAESA